MHPGTAHRGRAAGRGMGWRGPMVSPALIRAPPPCMHPATLRPRPEACEGMRGGTQSPSPPRYPSHDDVLGMHAYVSPWSACTTAQRALHRTTLAATSQLRAGRRKATMHSVGLGKRQDAPCKRPPHQRRRPPAAGPPPPPPRTPPGAAAATRPARGRHVRAGWVHVEWLHVMRVCVILCVVVLVVGGGEGGQCPGACSCAGARAAARMRMPLPAPHAEFMHVLFNTHWAGWGWWWWWGGLEPAILLPAILHNADERPMPHAPAHLVAHRESRRVLRQDSLHRLHVALVASLENRGAVAAGPALSALCLAHRGDDV